MRSDLPEALPPVSSAELSGGRTPVERAEAGAGTGSRRWFLLFWLSALLTVLTAATLVPHLSDSAELVRLRNALLLDAEPANHDWRPDAPPPTFRLEKSPPNPLFADAVARGHLRIEGDDWATALRIGKHLLAGSSRNGGAIQSSLDDTYRRITEHGDGYCGDFADVFTGLATAAGVFSRPWAFSFDGFGGRGHIFNEIWDSASQRWIMIDVFNNLYFTDEAGRAMSAVELRAALDGEQPPKIARIDADSRPGFKYDDKAIEYYRRGLPEWYMWWGNNVFEYDQAPIVRALGGTHRALEQLGGIAAGVHPRVRILEATANETARGEIADVRLRLLAVVGFGALALLFALVGRTARRFAPREAEGRASTWNLGARTAPAEMQGVGENAGECNSAATIVVFSTLFPSEVQPVAGLFIRERMFRVGKHIPIVVVAPQPWFPLQALIRQFYPGYRPRHAAMEIQDGVEVYFPLFFAIPGLFRWLDGFSMAVCVLPMMRRLRQQRRTLIVDAHFAYPSGYAAVLLGRWLRAPVTITLRGTETSHFETPSLRARVVEAVLRADRVFSVSDSLRRLLMEAGVPAGRIKVIGNGVDLTKFHPIDRVKARQQLGLPKDAKVLISVGGLVERKGFHRVIEVLPALVRRWPELRYLIVGGASPAGDMSEELRRQVKALRLEKNVVFTGPIPPQDLHVPLSAADLFVLATRHEGWANVFLEAMACGLPVVTTRVGGNEEVVRAPELGLIVPFGDSAALTHAVEEALTRNWDFDGILDYARRNDWAERVAVLVTEFRHLIGNSSQAGGR